MRKLALLAEQYEKSVFELNQKQSVSTRPHSNGLKQQSSNADVVLPVFGFLVIYCGLLIYAGNFHSNCLCSNE